MPSLNSEYSHSGPTRFSMKVSLMSWAWWHTAVISALSGWRQQEHKHKAILNYRTKLTQRYRKRMIFPYGTFPVTIINGPAKRIRVEALSFAVYNSNAGPQDLVVTGTSESLCPPNDAL